MSEIVIERLAERHIDGVMEVSEAEFGHLYKKPEKFRKDIDDPNVAVYVATENGKVIGFGRSVSFGPDGIDDILKLPDSRERDLLMTKKRIVLFDALAIREDEQGKGIGSKLFPLVEEEFPCDIIVVMAWKNCKDGHINVHPLLVKKGYTQTELEVKGYWNLMVDEPEGHYCPVCGAPDRCSAVLYIKEITN